MTEKEFEKKIDLLYESGKLWSSMTSGVSHAGSHVSQTINDELYSIIYKEKEAHSSFKDVSKAEKALYELLTFENNAHKLYRFLQNADVGDAYKITFSDGKVTGTGIAQDYSGNLKARYSKDVRAVFYKSADSKDALGLNLDTCFPLTTSEHSHEIKNVNLAPHLEKSGLLRGMCPEEQTYWWTAANSAINDLTLDYSDGEFTAIGTERVTGGRGYPVSDVTLKMTLTRDDCLVETDDGKTYDLLDEKECDKFCEDFPQSSAEFLTSFDFHEGAFAAWSKGHELYTSER